MKRKIKLSAKLTSLLLSFAMLIAYVPILSVTTAAALTPSAVKAHISDTHTMDNWKEWFGSSVMSTEHAGGVWLDKSVLSSADALSGTGITMKDENGFLTVLSTMASNMTVTGQKQVPTDTVLVLDVSGSMNAGDNDVAEELVEAANESIHALLTANPYSRVSVILYSGSTSSNDDAATTLLPLGRYTPDANGDYLNYELEEVRLPIVNILISRNEYISVDPEVVYAGTSTKPTAVTKEVVGATYMQQGIAAAVDQFLADDNEVTVEDPNVGTLNRMPIVVLMSDGAPSLGTTDFTNPGSYNLGTGSGTSAALGFTAQLTMAYAKSQIESKYNSNCLFYTLGLGVSNDGVAIGVLDPDNVNASTALDAFWDRYNDPALAVGGTVTVSGSGNDALSVTKIETVLEQNYVDEYFGVTEGSADLAQGLKDAFEDIMGTIALKTRYNPTLIKGDDQLSGYISFVDRIGAYMQVTDIKGILIHNSLFSGADLASNFAGGVIGGAFGSSDNLSADGREMVNSVKARLGIEDDATAFNLIKLAVQHGQLGYHDANDFSNYIGWYANAAGEFLGFWHEGITSMPDPDDPSLTDETRPAFIVKSYGYLGEVDESHGVSKSDMMYATVQVRENIKTGEELVTFAVPAALIPIVTYEVTLSETGELSELVVSGAEHPIRLVYEVALRSDINEVNLTEKVSADYLAANTNPDGSVNFYASAYDVNNTTGYGTVNSYAYFNPSKQNNTYYFTEDSPIYTDTNGTLYTGTEKPDPNGTFYSGETVYAIEGGVPVKHTVYCQITSTLLATDNVVKNENDNGWHVKAGTVHLCVERNITYKGGVKTEAEMDNKTGTLKYANAPFVDVSQHGLNEDGYFYFVGATMGNNGKLTVMPATGIKITKAMADGVADPALGFVFNLESASLASTTLNGYLVTKEGDVNPRSVTFGDNGHTQVMLTAGDTFYLVGLSDGDAVTISENEDPEYVVKSINGQAQSSITITAESGKIAEAAFVNTLRGKGSLTITKEIEHNLGADHVIPADMAFTVKVTLRGLISPGATFDTAHSGDANLTSVSLDDNLSFTVTLKNDEQFEIFGLPEGTVATVVEQNPGTGFTPTYFENDMQGDGQVVVIADAHTFVAVINGYEAQAVTPNIEVSGNKTVSGKDEWEDNYSFDFELQRWDASAGEWVQMGTTATATKTNKSFVFTDAFVNALPYTATGTYHYRVVEIEPTTGKLGGITYDKTVHSFTVVVTDADMDGTLEISDVHSTRDTVSITKNGDAWSVEVNFTNTYSTSGSATATIDLNKTVTNAAGSPLATPNGFTFTLTPTGNTAGAPITSLATNDRGFARLVLTYDAIGTYTYTLTENAATAAGWQANSQSYTVVVNVYDDGNGGLGAVIALDEIPASGATNSLSVSFNNVYEPASYEFDLDFVTKKLVGRDMTPNDVFTFEVQTLDGTTLLEGTNAQDGKVTFVGTDGIYGGYEIKDNKILLTTVGVHEFHVLETSASGNGITVDNTVYHVRVTVTDNGGVLEATYQVMNDVSNTIEFVNVYKAAPTSATVTAKKEMIGRPLLNDEFAFILTVAENADGDVSYDAPSRIVFNRADGSIVFDPISYTAAGTYYYVLAEVVEDTSDGIIVYDETQYLVTVVVTDNGVGALVVDSVTYSDFADDVSEVIFENEYVPHATSVILSGHKTLEGKELEEGEFYFQLFEADGNWTADTDNGSVVLNGADGNFSFPSILFDRDKLAMADAYANGTYYFHYVVMEGLGGETIDGVTYDDTEYRVVIELTDDLMGRLHARALVYDVNNIPQAGLFFVNTFEAEIAVNVTVDKTVNNLGSEPIGPEDFDFNMVNVDDETDSFCGKTDEDGKLSFALNFTQDDIGKTYTYKVTEIAGNVENVTYSDAEYVVVITITLGENNVLVSNVTVNGNSLGTESVTEVILEFVNEYDYTVTTEDETTEAETTEAETTEAETTEAETTDPENPGTGDHGFHAWFLVLLIGCGLAVTVSHGKMKRMVK